MWLDLAWSGLAWSGLDGIPVLGFLSFGFGDNQNLPKAEVLALTFSVSLLRLSSSRGLGCGFGSGL